MSDHRSPEWRGDASQDTRYGEEIEEAAPTREFPDTASPTEPYGRGSPYVAGGSGYGQTEGYGYPGDNAGYPGPSSARTPAQNTGRRHRYPHNRRWGNKGPARLPAPKNRPIVVAPAMMSWQKNDPFNGMPFPKVPGRPGDRDRDHAYFVNQEFLKNIVRTGSFGYPAPERQGEFAVNWNRVFETKPFFISPNFILADIDALRVGNLAWHNPRRFRDLAPMSDCVELYAFAPWLHPVPVEQKFEELRRYCDGNGEFPGRTGITIEVLNKPAFRRQVLIQSLEFRHELVPARPETFGRALYLQEFLRSRRSWSPLNGEPSDLTGVDAWLLKDSWNIPYIRRIAKREFPEVTPKDAAELVFDVRFLFLNCQVQHDFRFHFSMEAENATDRTFRDNARAVGNQAARVDCYLPPVALESKYLNIAAAQRRYLSLPLWFKERWWHGVGLVVDIVPYAHYMCERMMTPELVDWQVFLTEYVITVAVAWLHAMYNDYRMHRLSPLLGKTLETLPDEASEALGGMRNVEDLRSLARIHNRIEWSSIHKVHTVECKGIPYAPESEVEKHAAMIEFDPWGRFVFALERMRYDTRRMFYRVRPEGYPTGRLNPGDYPEPKMFLTGYHSVIDYPAVEQKSWWFHHVRLTYDYTHLHPDPARVAPMMLQISDGSYVLVPGVLLPGRSDGEEKESPPHAQLSWRSYYPGFPEAHPGLVSGWYSRLMAFDNSTKPMEVTDIRPRRLGELYPGFCVYEKPFKPASAADWADYDRREAAEEEVGNSPEQSQKNLQVRGRKMGEPFVSSPRSSDSARLVGPDEPLHRLRRSDFTSRMAYQIYLAQVAFWAPRDPTWRVSETVAKLVGVPTDGGESEDEEDLAHGVYEYDDQDVILRDQRDDRKKVGHSPIPREVRYFSDGPVPSRGSIKDSVFPYLFYTGSVGSGFPGTVAADPPPYTRAIQAWGAAYRPSEDFMLANPDFVDYPYSGECKVYDSMHLQEPFMTESEGAPADSSSGSDVLADPADRRTEPKGLGERIRQRGEQGTPLKKRASVSPGPSPVRTRGGRSMRMTAGNISKPSQRVAENVIEIVDEAPTEPRVIQPRRSPAKATSPGAGPSSAPKPSKKPGNSPAADGEPSDLDEDLDESAKNRADAETAEELKAKGSFRVGTTPGRATKPGDARSTRGRSKRRGGVTGARKAAASKTDAAMSDEEVEKSSKPRARKAAPAGADTRQSKRLRSNQSSPGSPGSAK